MVYGYTRTSTKEQHLDRGILEIEEFCKSKNIKINKIYVDQITGKTFDRKNFNCLKRRLKKGDWLIITEVDRFGRSRAEILNEMHFLRRKGVRLMVLELPTTLLDFSHMGNEMAELMADVINSLFLEIYAGMAELEFKKNKKRQMEGIEAKKLRGEWDDYGRPRKVELEEFRQKYEIMQRGEITQEQLTHMLKISNSTYYRYRQEIKKAEIE